MRFNMYKGFVVFTFLCHLENEKGREILLVRYLVFLLLFVLRFVWVGRLEQSGAYTDIR